MNCEGFWFCLPWNTYIWPIHIAFLGAQVPALEAELRSKLIDDFSGLVLTGALKVVADPSNPIRLNLFAAAMRELFGHTLHALAPDANVTKCEWFKLEPHTNGPTRRQRTKYATQGGLSDDYIEEIGVDVEHLHDAAIKAVEEMSKYTHVRPGTIVTEPHEITVFVAGAMHALLGLFASFDECRSRVLDALSEEIDGEAVNALITETIQSVDELATHHSVEEVYVEQTRVIALTHETIYFKATGTLAVELQWGSNSDLRRGDGATLDDSFPFEVTMESPIDGISTFNHVEYSVDTRKWHSNDDRDWR
jgi:hypothetical protein